VTLFNLSPEVNANQQNPCTKCQRAGQESNYVTYEIVKKLQTEIRFFIAGLMGWIGSCYSPEKQNLVEKKGIL
jgi:hypothetical protein